MRYCRYVMTVIVRDDAPLVHANDTPSYRTVRIKLTPGQCAAINRVDDPLLNHDLESISKAIIEQGET